MSKRNPVKIDAGTSDPFESGRRCWFEKNTQMVCDNCGETLPMPMGLLPFVTTVGKAFCDAHQHCKPKPAPDPQKPLFEKE